MRATYRSWVCGLVLIRATMPAAQAQTTTQSVTANVYITATVINSCSFDSTAAELLSITCSMQTPIAASSAAPTVTSGGTEISLSVTTNAPNQTPLETTKFCNFLAAERLENASFNQFTSDISRNAAEPVSYYSTLQVCF